MNVAYLLSSGSLSGGAKVVLEHANILNKIWGINAVVLVKDDFPCWFSNTSFVVKKDFFTCDLSQFDILITTFYNQAPIFLKWKSDVRFLHFCQGYEGDYVEYFDKDRSCVLREINFFYELPYPKLTVNNYLKYKVRSITSAPVYCVGQGLDFRKFTPSIFVNKKKWLLIVGPYIYPFKGVKKALEVALELKKEFGLEIVRVSNIDTSHEEKALFSIDYYYSHVLPDEMPSFYQQSLLLIYLPEKEGFGLPVLEAMACGLPVVASNIEPLREIAGEDYPLCEDEDSAFKLAKRLILDSVLYETLKERGVKRARRFSYKKVLINLIKVLLRNYFFRR